MNNKKFLSDIELDELVKAIQKAEEGSSGEIRVHIDRHTNEDFAEAALKIFYDLGMQKTKQRNSILFYLNFKNRYLTIIGDEEIHKKVHQSFWDKMHDEITSEFKKQKYFEPLKKAILKTGSELKKFFPDHDKPENELPNDITFS